MKAEPLKITFRFASPVVVDSEYPVFLDGLLAYAAVLEAKEKNDENAWAKSEELPLAKAGDGADWVFKASRLVFTPLANREIVNMQRKSSPEMFYDDYNSGLWGHPKLKEGAHRNPPTINTMSGQFRAYQYYVSTQWMDNAVAWCVGNKEEIERLLATLSHVGKMGRNGFGLIESITVEHEPDAETKWALRVLPVGIAGVSGTEYVPVSSPPRAPYWDKLRRVEMMEPLI